MTASDLNASLTQIVNNGTDVAFPLTKNSSLGGFSLFFDAANTRSMTDGTKGQNLVATAVNDAKTTVASAATPDIWTSTGALIDYTGAVTATGFAAAAQAGSQRSLLCAGAAAFTAGANMLIDGVASGANYTATAGDVVDVIAVTTTQFRLKPRPYSGSAVVVDNTINDFRLTLTTAVPVTTSDVTAAETLYCAPYAGNKMALYDGANWNIRTSAEMSIDVPDVTGVHDVFCYDNAGVPTLEVLVWSTETARATALTTQDGVLVKTGALTRRYLGTFYSTVAGNGQIEDSYANRYLWNYYNQAPRPLRRMETTGSWNYGTTTARQANGSTLNQVNFVIGVSQSAVVARIQAGAKSSAAADEVAVQIALDGTTSTEKVGTRANVQIPVNAYTVGLSAFYSGFPGIGKHYLAWLEWPFTAAGTITWWGTTAADAGIIGEILG